MKIVTSTVALFFLGFGLLHAQQRHEYNLADWFKKSKITVVNRQAEVAANNALKLSEKDGEGIAWLNGVDFSNGTIEFELKGRDVLQKSFLGIAFHGVNDSTYDAIYFRPFNFHAADPIRKIHAVQYIDHPINTWSKLREERNGEFEKALINPPDPNNWFRARVVVEGETVTVFVNDDDKPSLTIRKLNARTSGKLGLWLGNGSDGQFRNLIITSKK
jgi:hypothetical protein